jgi:hypothetical protein
VSASHEGSWRTIRGYRIRVSGLLQLLAAGAVLLEQFARALPRILEWSAGRERIIEIR